MPRDPQSPTTRGRDLLAALSFGTLCFATNVTYWTAPTNDYYLRGENQDALLACLAAMAIFAAFGYTLLRLARSSPVFRTILLWLALPATLFVLNRVRVAIGIPMPNKLVAGIVIGVVVARLLVAMVREPLRTSRCLHAAYRWAAALALMILGTLGMNLAAPPKIAPEREGGPATSKPPIVWVVFDELDQGWLFDHRPADLKLPSFDALANQSLVCTQAERPGPETLVSLPALTTGKPLNEATIVSRNELSLRFADGTTTEWSKADNVFAAMKGRGWTPAIDGYYHNYPGVFDGQVGQIRTWGYLPTGFWPLLEHNLSLLIPGTTRLKAEEALGRLSFWNRANADQHRNRLEAQMAVLERTIRSRSADFVFFHCRVPHWPWILDYRTGKEGFVPNPDGYLGNVKSADETLGRLVAILKEEGLWDRTTLLVTSDHNLRDPIRGVPLNRLVPLILKLPHQRSANVLKSSVKAVDERWLLEAIAEGKVRSADEAAQFLLSRR